MPELNDEDAIRMAVDYYAKQKGFRFEDAAKIVGILLKVDIAGLMAYAFNAGACANAKQDSRQREKEGNVV